MARYRILSLDGGGIRGLLTVVILQELEQNVPGWIDKVDLITGTSTGGIIALGLAHDKTPAELRDLYYDKGPIIFKDTLWDDLRDLFGLIGAEYGTENLGRELESVFQRTKLKELAKKVLISTFDMYDPKRKIWKPKFFHNYEGDDSDGDTEAYKVALYTSAAPTYFPWVDRYIDGGVVANNPSMAALTQTQDERNSTSNFRDGKPPRIEEIRLLSIGTGMVPYHVEGENRDWGYLQWIKGDKKKPIIDIVLQGIAGVADYQCQQLLGKERYHRISPTLSKPINMDDWQERDELVRIAKEDVNLTEAMKWLKTQWMK